MLLHCSCPCEFYCKHIYAVLKGIQNGFEKKFYKVVFNDENKDLLNRVTNNDFILCIGYFEGRLRLINNFGEKINSYELFKYNNSEISPIWTNSDGSTV